MAYDEGLAGRVRSVLSSRSGVEEKSLFGGLTFTINGNMCCAINSRGFVLRVGTENYEKVLQMPNLKPQMLGTKPMKGMVVAEPEAYSSDEKLADLVNMAADVAGALPPKQK
jgi:TfoX/Sxy family transcriptional regulator of competence genes